jgi:hypothetical protein
VAERGGTFRESFSMAKAYTEARREAGASPLLEIAKSKPKLDRTRAHSLEEQKEQHLGVIREAVALLEGKASVQPGSAEPLIGEALGS